MFWKLASLFFVGFAHGLVGELPVSLREGSYHKIPVTKELKSRLSRADIVSLTVENPQKTSAVFFLVFEDAESKGYWSRLNFKTTLNPGENRISFELGRKVGERGSSKSMRKLDFKRLKKAYVVVNPDSGWFSGKKYKLTSFQVRSERKTVVPDGVLFFDFAGSGARRSKITGAFNVDEKTSYDPMKGFGFSSIDLWRATDSMSAPSHLSGALSVNSASFKIKLAPGKYRYRLIWDQLGYWDVPFWKARSFYIDGNPERLERRSGIRDFLKDYLSLMGEPPGGISAFDYYYPKIFKPVIGEFSVKEGKVTFKFEGDPTGAALNTLVVWPKSKEESAKAFLLEVEGSSKSAFERKYRPVGSHPPAYKGKLRARVVSSPSQHKAQTPCSGKTGGGEVGARNGRVFFDFCVQGKATAPVSVKLGQFKGPKGKIPEDKLNLSLYAFRPKSIDLNHESYEVKADTLVDLEQPSFEPNGYSTRYLNLSLQLSGIDPGNYHGSVEFEQDGGKSLIPLSVTVLDAKYQTLPVKAGFIGLSPFPITYFQSEDKQELDAAFRKEALRKLSEAGFSLFTDIPEIQLAYTGPSKKVFSLQSEKADEFVASAPGKEIFIYQGNFPKALFTGNDRNVGQSEKSFWKNLTDELEKFANKHKDKKLIYLYSDEATGYRDAVKEDIKALEKYKKIFPSMKFGGFGNVNTWEKGKMLYQKWDYGFYSEVPGQSAWEKLKRSGQEVGLYNLCAGPLEDLSFCFGQQLYRLSKAGVGRYMEWHSSAVHNYPGFDLDGREADIALFYPDPSGKVKTTKRFVDATKGLEIAKKFFLLERYLKERKAPGLEEIKAAQWLRAVKEARPFPVSSYRKTHLGSYPRQVQKLDLYLKKFFSN